MHSRKLLPAVSSGLLAFLLAASHYAVSQIPAAEPASAPAASAIIQPALATVQQSLANLNISHWKAPGEVRSAAQQNVSSIQRDLSATLPGLLSQADSSGNSVPTAFAVYRNLDALYDVLLRVNETASLAAPHDEADSLFSALHQLESARSQLGDAILQSSQEREAQILRLQASVKSAPPAPAAAPAKANVVDDGPTAMPAKKKKRPAPKPAPKAAAAPQTPPQ